MIATSTHRPGPDPDPAPDPIPNPLPEPPLPAEEDIPLVDDQKHRRPDKPPPR